MDAKTIRIYDVGAATFAQNWEVEQAPPCDLQEAVKAHFREGLTVDVGCGSGRDTAWLVGQGFDAFGIDASSGLLEEALRRHPGVRFEEHALPELSRLGRSLYVNVLCETVIMHLPKPQAMAAVVRLTELLTRGGTLYLSWRITEGTDRRDEEGRLYAAFKTDLVRESLGDLETLVDERIVSASSGNVLQRIIARRV